MSRVKTWLVSDKKFLYYFRALSRKLPNHCHSLLYSSTIRATNFSSYLSFLLQTKSKRNPASPAPRVPPTGGTLSFHSQKNLLLFEMEKIPSRYREGLVRFLKNYRPSVFLCSIFSPRSFTSGLAEESDFYFIKKGSWHPIAVQLKSVIGRLSVRSSTLPEFPRKFSLQEKLVMRILWRFRRQFISLDELSSYIYGRKMSRNLHASEVKVCELREKLKKITGRSKVINWERNYGYKMEDEIWDELLK